MREQQLTDIAEWQERALCAQTDPESFFPEKGGSTTGGEAGLPLVRGPGRVPRVRAGARRALRHLGRAVRAGASPAEEAGWLILAGTSRVPHAPRTRVGGSSARVRWVRSPDGGCAC